MIFQRKVDELIDDFQGPFEAVATGVFLIAN